MRLGLIGAMEWTLIGVALILALLFLFPRNGRTPKGGGDDWFNFF